VLARRIYGALPLRQMFSGVVPKHWGATKLHHYSAVHAKHLTGDVACFG